MSTDPRTADLLRTAAEMCDVLGSDLRDSPLLSPGLPADMRLVAQADGVVLDMHARKGRPSLVDAMASDIRSAQSCLLEGLVESAGLSADSRRAAGVVADELGRLQSGLAGAGSPSAGYFCEPADVSPLTRPDVGMVPGFLSATAGLLRSGSVSSLPYRAEAGGPGSLRMDVWFSSSESLCPAEVLLLRAGDLGHDLREALGAAPHESSRAAQSFRSALSLLDFDSRYGAKVAYGSRLRG